MIKITVMNLLNIIFYNIIFNKLITVISYYVHLLRPEGQTKFWNVHNLKYYISINYDVPTLWYPSIRCNWNYWIIIIIQLSRSARYLLSKLLFGPYRKLNVHNYNIFHIPMLVFRVQLLEIGNIREPFMRVF